MNSFRVWIYRLACKGAPQYNTKILRTKKNTVAMISDLEKSDTVFIGQYTPTEARRIAKALITLADRIEDK